MLSGQILVCRLKLIHKLLGSKMERGHHPMFRVRVEAGTWVGPWGSGSHHMNGVGIFL